MKYQFMIIGNFNSWNFWIILYFCQVDSFILCNCKKIYSNETPHYDEALTQFKTISRSDVLTYFLYRKLAPTPCCFLCSTAFLRKNGLKFNESVKFSEDQVFFWEAFNCSKEISYTDTIIYNYFVRDNSITTKPIIAKIITGYEAIKKESLELELNNECKSMMLGRWVFGTLHNTSKYCDFSLFKQLCMSLDYKERLKEIKKFRDVRVRFLSRVCLFSRRIGYLLFRLK